MANTYTDLLFAYAVFATFIAFFVFSVILKQKRIAKDLDKLKSQIKS